MPAKDRRTIITLTTDFGHRDHYVGSLRGVIHDINPQVKLIDITHDIPSYDIIHGAYVIGSTYYLFPRGTIHVGVVDPGVGGRRLPILVQTENYFFIGPDNGLFSMVSLREKIVAIYHLTNPRYFRPEVSQTFHGRDLFTPVAAHLARGVKPRQFGARVREMRRLPLFAMDVTPHQLQGHIIAIDKFGNAITNITREAFSAHVRGKSFVLQIGSKRISRICETYSQVAPGEAVAVFGSNHLLELALYQGSIADFWRLKRGQSLTARIVPARKRPQSKFS